MVASPFRYAIVHKLRGASEPITSASRLPAWRQPTWCWWRASSRPPFPVSRSTARHWAKPPLHAEDGGFLAIVTDAALDTDLPCLPLNDPAAVADFIVRALGRG